MATSPTVSIAIPLYNCASLIRETIDSVLVQTYRDFELIIIDDQSTDDSYSIVKSYTDPRISIIQNTKRKGFFENWNACLEQMKGPYCKLLPHDDTLEPTCLEEQVKVLEKNPKVTLVHSARRIIDPKGKTLCNRLQKEKEGIKSGIMSLRRIVRSGTNPIGEPAAVLFRNTTKEQIGQFSDADMFSIDIDYWARLLAEGDRYYINQILCTFRVWPDSASVRLFGSQAGSMHQFYKNLQSRYPEAIREYDVWIGSAKSIFLELARGIFYRLMNQKMK